MRRRGVARWSRPDLSAARPFIGRDRCPGGAPRVLPPKSIGPFLLAVPIGPASGARSRRRPHRLEQRQTATRTTAAGGGDPREDHWKGPRPGRGLRRHLLTPENGRRCDAEPLMRRPCSRHFLPYPPPLRSPPTHASLAKEPLDRRR
ncbi:hypothetical protein MRX96_012503 [Rhipicephalus microplus]